MLTGNLPIECKRTTTGGKGNRGKYIERSPRVCAAGVPTAQADLSVESALRHYLLSDEVSALVSDAIVPPPPPPRKLAPLRNPIQNDQRNCGINSELHDLLRPPVKTKFQVLVNDLKETIYRSYWKVPLGQIPDPIPQFPMGYDINNTTYGKREPDHENLYDIIMPKDPLPDKTPPCNKAAFQTDRNYCRPAFNPDLTFGHRSNIDPRGIYVKACLTDDRIVNGVSSRVCITQIQADTRNRFDPTLEEKIKQSLTIGSPPITEGFQECFSPCKINPNLCLFRKCLEHLNTLRKVMSTRFLPTFFKKCYLNLKHYDHDKTGWLPKKIVYDYCTSKLIRFDPSLIEPLLCLWEAFDGENIEYKMFSTILNFKQPLPALPKVPDYDPNCLDYRTTYGEMIKPKQFIDGRRRAGVPSGRYFDMDYPVIPEEYCKADLICLPDETDVGACLRPCIFTLHHVNHREMYAKRDPALVKKVFERAGEKFTDERFNQIWEEAKKYHSEGWVCYETFRKALDKFPPLE